MDVPFDDVDVFRSIVDEEIIYIKRTFDDSTPVVRPIDLIIELIFKPKRVTADKILPCGTPIYWS